MTDRGTIRVSSDEQKNSGKSIEEQKTALINAGISEKEIYIDEGKSGGVHDEDIDYKWDGRKFHITIDMIKRPEFRKLWNALKRGDAIKFTKLSRLSRDIIFTEAFYRYALREGLELIPLRDTSEKLTRRILTAINQTELETTTERNDSIQEYLYNQGLHPFRPPYGYLKNIRNKSGQLKYPSEPEGMLIINEKEAEIVRQIYSLIKMHTQQEVSNIMHMHPTAIRNILNNPTYKGYVSYKKEKKKGQHKAIIPESE